METVSKPASKPDTSDTQPLATSLTLEIPSTYHTPSTASPTEHQDVEVPYNKQGRRSRSSSPSVLPTELTLKVQCQLSRITLIKNFSGSVKNEGATLSVEEVNVIDEQVEAHHKAFIKQHSYLEITWPGIHKTHSYFSDDMFSKEALVYGECKMLLAKIRATHKRLQGNQPLNPSTNITAISNLPKISLPTFSGDFASWVMFKETFQSVVMNNPQLDNISKLHYLREYTRGRAHDAIVTLPFSDEGFLVAWDTLKQRFENKRRLVNAQLDQIFSEFAEVKRASSRAAQLTALITTIKNAVKSIELLGQSTENWDCFLVYHITRHLDKDTKEKWETKLGDNQELPTFQEFLDFLSSRIRTLENIEVLGTHPTSGTQQHQRVSSKASHVSHQAHSRYVCDYCSLDHFIAHCTKFEHIPSEARLKLIKEKKLCLNCMGRHNTPACRSNYSCRKCPNRHHTLLHDAIGDTSSARQQNKATC